MKRERLEWDTPEWRKVRNLKLLKWLGDDAQALDCLLKLSHIAEVWDDLIDKDVEVLPASIDSAFVAAMVKLEVNPFWERNRHHILPVVWIAINAWMDAEDLRKGHRTEKALAFYIRNYSYELTNIIVMCARGWDALRDLSLEMRRFFTHESYFTWEHRDAADL